MVNFDRNWEVDMESLLKVAEFVVFNKLPLILTDSTRKCTLRSRVSRSCNL
jgi:hypothetical protein